MARPSIRIGHVLTIVALLGFAGSPALAQRGGGRGGGQARASTGGHHKKHTGNSRSTHHGAGGTQHTASRGGNRNVAANNVSRSGNRVNNGNINTGDVNVNVHGGYGDGYGPHPVARGVVAGATAAAVMGHYYNTLPSGCATVTQGGIVYHHCGSTWYRTEGHSYLVVPQP